MTNDLYTSPTNGPWVGYSLCREFGAFPPNITGVSTEKLLLHSLVNVPTDGLS